MTTHSINSSSQQGKWNVLPAELLGRSIQCLTVGERLRSERVSPRWHSVIWALGWSDLRTLDLGVVFERATPLQRDRFTDENLTSLLSRVGPSLVDLDLASFRLNRLQQYQLSPNLVELDLTSFGLDRLQQFARCVAKPLQQHSPKLEKLNITGFDLADFVDGLPSTLRQLETSGTLSVQTLETLARRCPELEEVPFHRVVGINLDIVNAHIGSFLRLKKLCLTRGNFVRDLGWTGGMTRLGQLKHLEVLELNNFGEAFDERAAEAMAVGCQSLRKLDVFSLYALSEAALLHMAKLPNLTVLQLNMSFSTHVNAFLRAIAVRGKLKKVVMRCRNLTDDTVEFLLERCKSLVSLDVSFCFQLTVRALDAVVAEVRRRHGSPPRALPTGPTDHGVFYFCGVGTQIDLDHLFAVTMDNNDDNSWLRIEVDDPREII